MSNNRENEYSRKIADDTDHGFENNMEETIDDLANWSTTQNEAGKRLIGRYLVEKTVAIRSHSTVFKAYDPDLQRFVSLKIYDGQNEITQGSDRVKRVLAEARALVRVDSPFVARCFNVETLNDTPVLVNEWIEGTNLEEYFQSEQLTFAQVKSIFTKVVRGVGAIHKQNLLHRDLKPSNIIIDSNGEPKIIDLGIVQDLNETPEEFGGTISFIAPEVVNQKSDSIGPQTDIFGLGAVLYFMLTGRSIYEAETKSELLELASRCEIPASHRIANSSPNQLDRVAEKCLQSIPENRFQSVQEILKHLRSRNRRLVFALISTVIVVLFFSLFLYPFSPSSRGRSKSDSGEMSKSGNDGKDRDIPIERSLFRQAIDAALDEDFETASRLATQSQAQLDSENPDYHADVRLHFLRLADFQLQVPDLDAAVSIYEARVRFEMENSQHPFIINDAKCELREIEKLRNLDRKALQDYSAAKRLLFDAEVSLRPGPNQAEIAREKAIAAHRALENVLGDDHGETIRALWHVANTHYAAGHRVKACEVLAKVRIGLIRLYGSETEKLLQFYENSIVANTRVLGRPDLALRDANAAIELSNELRGRSSIRTLSLRSRRCDALVSAMQYKEAEEAGRKIISDLGTDETREVEVAIARFKLAESLMHLSKYDESQIEVRQAIELAKKNFERIGKARFVWAQAMLIMAELRAQQKEFDEAVDICQKVIRLISANRVAKEAATLARARLAIFHARAGNDSQSDVVISEVELTMANLQTNQAAVIFADLALASSIILNEKQAAVQMNKSVKNLDLGNLVSAQKVIDNLKEIAKTSNSNVSNVQDAFDFLEKRFADEKDSLDEFTKSFIEKELNSLEIK